MNCSPKEIYLKPANTQKVLLPYRLVVWLDKLLPVILAFNIKMLKLQ